MAQADYPGEGKTVEPEVVEITRYPNRRLYDRSRGQYVTLQEVADTVRRGKTVAVRDSKTGADLTRTLLTQIILEQYPERMELVPVAVLHCLIRADAVVLEFLRAYFRQALAYLEVLQRSATVYPFVPPLDWMSFFLPNRAPPDAGPAADSPEALARRIAVLEQRLAQMGASEGAGRKNRSRGKGTDRGRAGTATDTP